MYTCTCIANVEVKYKIGIEQNGLPNFCFVFSTCSTAVARNKQYTMYMYIHVRVCLTLLASFFLPSHLSFKNMYMYIVHVHCSSFPLLFLLPFISFVTTTLYTHSTVQYSMRQLYIVHNIVYGVLYVILYAPLPVHVHVCRVLYVILCSVTSTCTMYVEYCM